VVGIVAARLKEATPPGRGDRAGGGIGKGSARSVPGVDLGAAVQRVAAEGLLVKGGGHKMAAGLTVAATSWRPRWRVWPTCLRVRARAAVGPRDLGIDSL
jgi:single-stranded-DNA-specific exonuclease